MSNTGEVRTADAYLDRLTAARDFDTMWTVVTEILVMEGVDAALRWAATWGMSSDCRVRAAALDLLAGVGTDVRTSAPRMIIEHARRVSARDDGELRWSAAHAIGTIGEGMDDLTRRCAAVELMRFAADEDDDVRWHVAVGLPDLIDEDIEPTAPAVETLLRLLQDPDPGVRDWAAFGFSKVESDSPRIRTALFALVHDRVSNGVGAGEAAFALAQRGDTRVIPLVREELRRADVEIAWLRAAAEQPHSSYLPELKRLAAGREALDETAEDGQYRKTWIEDAIQAAEVVEE